MKRQVILCCAMATVAAIFASDAQAQHSRHSGSRYVVPSYGNSRSNYYYRNNTYYYDSGNGRSQRVAYGKFSHVDTLAVRLERLANEFCLEIHYNYSNNRGFDETYREAYEMLRSAKYIHEEAHHGHHDEIAKEIRKLDDDFHHVEDEVENWRSNRGRHHHHAHGSDMHELLEEMESVIHHLMNDAGIKSGRSDNGDRGGVAPRPN